MQTYVGTRLIIKNIQSLEDIKNALISLGDIDADFCGDNGEEYLWKAAKKKDFETNAEYLADNVVYHSGVKNDGVLGFARCFAKKWLYNETYYKSIDINVVKLDGFAEDNNINGIYAFSITAIDNN